MHRLGWTRSSMQPDHAVITPDTHVHAPLPGWRGGRGAVLISPPRGGGFSLYLAELAPDGRTGAPPSGVERFAYVLDGAVALQQGGRSVTLGTGGFAYLPPEAPHGLTAARTARLCVVERRRRPHPGAVAPEPVVGHQARVAGGPYAGDPDLVLQPLLPAGPPGSLAVDLLTVPPGAALPAVAAPAAGQGLLLLQGGGIWRLQDRWYPLQAGDAVWAAPHCPRWFCAVGKEQARYLCCSDAVRQPLS